MLLIQVVWLHLWNLVLVNVMLLNGLIWEINRKLNLIRHGLERIILISSSLTLLCVKNIAIIVLLFVIKLWLREYICCFLVCEGLVTEVFQARRVR